MIFNKHSILTGQHAFLGASKYHWINYDLEKMERAYYSMLATQRGTDLHDLAHQLIKLGVKLPRTRKTLNMYLNDALGFLLSPEQMLYYSENCFGTSDAIGFRDNKLRVHDLKTGRMPASEHQLEIYAALFCLEYRMKPFDIQIELRIYQHDDIRIYEPDPDIILHIMDKIVMFDKHISILRAEVL